MATTRLRHAFKYPSEDEDEPDELDEEHQEKLIADLQASDAQRNDLYRLITLIIPLVSALYFIYTAIFSSSTAQQRLLALLSSSSVLCTAYLLLFMPLQAPLRNGNKAAHQRDTADGPVEQYLAYLSAALAALLLLAAVLSWRRGVYEEALKQALPAVIFSLTMFVRQQLAPLDLEDLQKARRFLFTFILANDHRKGAERSWHFTRLTRTSVEEIIFSVCTLGDRLEYWYWNQQAMALSGLRSRPALFIILSTTAAAVSAAPKVAFPFNSQVPTVARVGEPYLFQFSSSTFTPEASNFTYTISGQPGWLTVDSGTRTLSGTPGQDDAGASTFTITAADEMGVMSSGCTLVVSADPAPQLEGDISKQLAAIANLSNTSPPTVTILPSTSFHFTFQQNAFIDIVQRRLYYYATLSDHTPLPAWLLFDATSMTFSGNAPVLSAFPQSWNVDLIASDVAGFAGATASFAIVISTQQLAFVPAEQNVKISGGTQLDFTALGKQLFRNGSPLQPLSLTEASATGVPDWASFDSITLALTGTVPATASDGSISITVTDKLGDSATAVVNLVSGNASLFNGDIGTLTAYAGQAFTYRFPDSLFSKPNPELTVVLPPTATWLSYDKASQELQGTVPSQTLPTAIAATLVARTATIESAQTQVFTIDVKAATSSTIITTGPVGHASPTDSATPTLPPSALEKESHGPLAAGSIAAIVIASILAALIILALLLLCMRHRRRDGYERKPGTPVKKRTISRPFPVPETGAITITTELQRDVEKTAEGERPQVSSTEEGPPQIALDLPSRSTNRRSRWLNRFSHISQVSSLGNGEDAIRADSNIPEWGGESAAVHTPHDSFSVPTEMARVSRQLSQSSPTKLAIRRLRERRQNRQSYGLGIDTGDGMLMPRHNSKQSRSHKRGKSSLSLTAAFDRSSQASISTRGTSLLSTKPSDFPRPPTRSMGTMSRSVPTLSVTDPDQRQSIRLVGRSDSITDNRSVQDKRQSFIRNRASTSIQSPLFAHGSRAPSSTRPNGDESVAASSCGSAQRSRRGKSTLTSYSQSSSLEPQRESRRLSARVRSAFAPSYPRAITQSSLGADDEAAADDKDSDSGFETVSESIGEEDWRSQMTLPRHQRPFVLPGEASPTPPPAPPTSRQPSSGRRSAYSAQTGLTRQKWKERAKERSSSPLSTAVATSAADRAQGRQSRLSEPIDLVSKDSVTRAKMERPRLVHTSSGRPVSVEEAKRLSSLKAENGAETDSQAGSETWEDGKRGVELEAGNERRVGTERSNMSGPMFL
ncbi:polarity establishment/cellular polarization [Friedmanniomyces endolithicus]|nr:polarity establishment/cellular polarization [Friedmanniomyces endolithicus]